MKTAYSLFFLGALAGLPATAAPHLERVRDPDRLVAAGFPADAHDVWRLVDDPPRRPDGVRDVTGLPGVGSYSVTGDDFRMSATFSSYDTAGNGYLFCPTGATARVASATLDLPADRRLQFLDLWGRDVSAGDVLGATLIATCQAGEGAGSPNNIILAEVDSTGSSGDFFDYVAIPEHFPDPQRCAYAVNLVLGSEGTCEGDALQLYKVRVTWID